MSDNIDIRDDDFEMADTETLNACRKIVDAAAANAAARTLTDEQQEMLRKNREEAKS